MVEQQQNVLTYSPIEIGNLALDEIRSAVETVGRGISTGWHAVDTRLKPLRPEQLTTIIAYTSNYKTGFMTWWARRLALNLADAQREKEIVVYVSWEDTVEDMGIYDLAHDTLIDVTEIMEGRIDDAAMKRLELAAFKRGTLPLWIIGNSVARRKAAARMTMTQVEKALAWIELQMGFHPLAIFLDYVNLIAPEKPGAWGDGRRTDIMENTFRARDLALSRGCPVVMGAQAGRQVNERDWKLPQKFDAQESSAIEQYSDVMLSLWLPQTTETKEQLSCPDGSTLDIDEHLMIMGLLKQKKGPAGGWWPMYVDPARNEIEPLAATDIEPPAREEGDLW